MTNLKPLAPYEIRDLNREIQERLNSLGTLKTLVVVKSFKKGKCYGIGLSDPKKDLIMRNLVRLMGALYRPVPPLNLNQSVTLTDVSNAARTVYTSAGGLDTYVFNTATQGFGPTYFFREGVLLGFGNPASAPTPARTDYELASLVSTIIPSGTTTDETNWRVIVTGSYVWIAGGTVREAGLYGQFYYTSTGTFASFLLYHDPVSDVPVSVSGTVSVTYATQF